MFTLVSNSNLLLAYFTPRLNIWSLYFRYFALLKRFFTYAFRVVGF
jgi:hypothetical protein